MPAPFVADAEPSDRRRGAVQGCCPRAAGRPSRKRRRSPSPRPRISSGCAPTPTRARSAVRSSPPSTCLHRTRVWRSRRRIPGRAAGRAHRAGTRPARAGLDTGARSANRSCRRPGTPPDRDRRRVALGPVSFPSGSFRRPSPRAALRRRLARRCWHPPAANKTPLSQRRNGEAVDAPPVPNGCVGTGASLGRDHIAQPGPRVRRHGTIPFAP